MEPPRTGTALRRVRRTLAAVIVLLTAGAPAAAPAQVAAAAPPTPGTVASMLEASRDSGYRNILVTAPTAIHCAGSPTPVTISGRRFLLVHPVGEMTFDVPRGSREISAEFAIRPEALQLSTHVAEVEFRADYVPAGGGEPVTLWQQVLRPEKVPGDRVPKMMRVPLPPDAAGQVVLRTLPAPGAEDTSYGWACWARVLFDAPEEITPGGDAPEAAKAALVLEIDVSQSTTDSVFRVYFDVAGGYQESESFARPVEAGASLQHLRFPLPARTVHSVRLAPLAAAGTVVISQARILRAVPQGVFPVDLHRITPRQDIARLDFSPDSGALSIGVATGKEQPQCILSLDGALNEVPILGGWRAFVSSPARWPCLLLVPLAAILILTARWDRAARRDGVGRAVRSWQRRVTLALLGAPVVFYVWLLLLNMGRSALVPEQEPSWVAVLTYAIAKRWQFGRDIIMTYGPAMPLSICSYMGSIDTAVFVGRLVCKSWALVLLFWCGGKLPNGRRWLFWAAAVAVFGGFSEPALFGFTMVIAGLLLLEAKGAERWLIPPTVVFVATVALIKVTFVIYALLLLGCAALPRLWHRQWLAALLPGCGFALCFCAEWCLLGQNLANLPLYARGSLEIVGGYSQAMSLPPDPAVLRVGLVMGLASALQLLVFLVPGRLPQWRNLPMLGLLSGGLLLAWKQSFVRADAHVLEWMSYAIVSVIAVPAFFPADGGSLKRWLERAAGLIVILAGVAGLRLQVPEAGERLANLGGSRWYSSWQLLSHPRETARAQRETIARTRRQFALPRIRHRVGSSRVDVFCDEQAIAILNGLNFRPRPSFLNYCTYTPWLLDFNVAYYRSPQAPEYVLFKLASIDNRLPTAQNATLLLFLAEKYQPVLIEEEYTLFQRRQAAADPAPPASAALLAEGDLSLRDPLAIPGDAVVWCELDFQETLLGKLLKTFYQQPPLEVTVTRRGGQEATFRLVPKLAAAGFLINPLPTSSEEFLQWLAGQPLDPVTSIRLADADSMARVFRPRLHYKLRRLSLPTLQAE